MNRIKTTFKHLGRKSLPNKQDKIKGTESQSDHFVPEAAAVEVIRSLSPSVLKNTSISFSHDKKIANVTLPEPYVSFSFKIDTQGNEDQIIPSLQRNENKDTLEKFKADIEATMLVDFARNWDVVIYDGDYTYDFKKNVDGVHTTGDTPEEKLHFMREHFDKSIPMTFTDSRLILLI